MDTDRLATRTEPLPRTVVRAAEAAARTGLAHDAGAMLAIVLDRFPAALVGELTEDVDLAVFAGGPAPWAHHDVEVLERGVSLLG